jgi:hypothetical protein
MRRTSVLLAVGVYVTAAVLGWCLVGLMVGYALSPEGLVAGMSR